MLLGLALLSALSLSAAFAYDSVVAPYLSLVAFVPAMYVIRHLVVARDVVLFAVSTSLLGTAMVMYWMPQGINDVSSLGLMGSVLLSWALWLLWCGATALFLIAYRYCHGKSLLLLASLAVVLFNYWPSLFGVNMLLPLLNAAWLNGSIYFIGTPAVEVLVIMHSAYLVSALVSASLAPLYRALLIVLALLALDAFAAWYLSAAPTQNLNVALVQSANVYSKKLSSAAELEMFVQQIVDESAMRPELIVFPENVFTFNLAEDPDSANAAIDALKLFSAREDVALLISTIRQLPATQAVDTEQKTATYISSVLIGQGQQLGYADKARTIPFAELTPPWAVGMFRWFGASVEVRASAAGFERASVKGIPIIPLTCFESLASEVVEFRLGGRPGLLVNQSNMDSLGPPGTLTYKGALWAHMIHEQRWVNQWHVPIVRAVRGGGSAVIDAHGHLDRALLEQSWAEEWVTTQVSVPEALALDGYARLLRQALFCAIVFLGLLGLAQCLLIYLSNRRALLARYS